LPSSRHYGGTIVNDRFLYFCIISHHRDDQFDYSVPGPAVWAIDHAVNALTNSLADGIVPD
jgi:hypothetical protein